ncbi:MAG: hypothetical protein R3C03_03190 [Pirellulaceae bacterium]
MPASHWAEVRFIFESALRTKFDVAMVSESDKVGFIHESIVVNIFDNPLVVCDVSGSNPNVMFELGMRLAADKPVVIVKDQKTDFHFDISPIFQLEYPQDLRHGSIEIFKKDLLRIATSTFDASKEKSYSPFLKYFKKYEAKSIESVEESGEMRLERMVSEILGIVTSQSHKTEAVFSPSVLKRPRSRRFADTNEIQGLLEKLKFAVSRSESEKLLEDIETIWYRDRKTLEDMAIHTMVWNYLPTVRSTFAEAELKRIFNIT